MAAMVTVMDTDMDMDMVTAMDTDTDTAMDMDTDITGTTIGITAIGTMVTGTVMAVGGVVGGMAMESAPAGVGRLRATSGFATEDWS